MTGLNKHHTPQALKRVVGFWVGLQTLGCTFSPNCLQEMLTYINVHKDEGKARELQIALFCFSYSIFSI